MKFTVLAAVVAFFLSTLPTLAADDGIAWIPTWTQALQEAQRTNRPILLMSGAPECAGVPGVW